MDGLYLVPFFLFGTFVCWESPFWRRIFLKIFIFSNAFVYGFLSCSWLRWWMQLYKLSIWGPAPVTECALLCCCLYTLHKFKVWGLPQAILFFYMLGFHFFPFAWIAYDFIFGQFS